jgi:hypothetical protein
LNQELASAKLKRLCRPNWGAFESCDYYLRLATVAVHEIAADPTLAMVDSGGCGHAGNPRAETEAIREGTRLTHEIPDSPMQRASEKMAFRSSSARVF